MNSPLKLKNAVIIFLEDYSLSVSEIWTMIKRSFVFFMTIYRTQAHDAFWNLTIGASK